MSYMHGGHVVAKALKKEGVTHLFTLCGGHIQSIYDGCLDENIRIVDFRHEQSAAHAADGWARLTGQPGVCAVTAGPGVTDAVTGVANAFRAKVPMICIGGAGPRMYKDMGSLQDMDHVELMRPITKWSTWVTDKNRLAEYVASAFRVATSGVPGPVFLEMPLDLLFDSVDPDDVKWPDGYRSGAALGADPNQVDRAWNLLRAAERPMLIVGSQIRWSPRQAALASLLRGYAVPVFVNGMARGSLPPEHPALFTRCRKAALARADAVVLFGTPLDFRLSYGQSIPNECKLIQVDLDAAEIGRNRRVDVGVPGDTGIVLDMLGERAARDKITGNPDWLTELRGYENAEAGKLGPELASNSEPINPLRLCAEINKHLREDTIVIGDGGDFVATAAYNLGIRRPYSWMDPGPLGTLGVGPGYAMAAKLAYPDRQVVIIFGDGSFGLNAMEFEAMARQKLPIVSIIGNDAAWTQIRRGQVAMYGDDRAVATKLDYTRYDKVVEALGGYGVYVERLADLPGALRQAFAAQVPSCVNVKIGGSDFRKNAISV